MSSAQSDSHSAQFGLNPQSKPTQNAGSGPGSGIEGTTGVKGHKNSVASSTTEGGGADAEVGGVNAQYSGSERPGAGSAVLVPSQGSNKTADDSGGLLDKLNPLKKSSE